MCTTYAQHLLSHRLLHSLVLYHVAYGNYSADKLTSGLDLETYGGYLLPVKRTEGVTSLGQPGATIIAPNLVEASDGIAHGVDAILLPSFLNLLDEIHAACYPAQSPLALPPAPIVAAPPQPKARVHPANNISGAKTTFPNFGIVFVLGLLAAHTWAFSFDFRS